MNKAIFIDLDQTIIKLHKNFEVSVLDKNALKKAQREGWYVIITTGRSKKDAEKVWKKIKYNEKANFIIYSAGMNIENFETGEYIQREIFDKEVIERYIVFAIENRAVIKLSNQKGIFIYRKSPFSWMVEKLFDIRSYKYDEMNIDFSDLSKVGVGLSIFFPSKTTKFFEKVKKEFPEIDFLLIGSKRYLEAVKSGYNKGTAAQKLAELLDIDLKKSIAIGDSMNDLTLFKVVGYPVAMKNAVKHLKLHSKYITKSIYKSGVSEFINHHLDNEKRKK